MTLTLTERAIQLEAFETDQWAAKAICEVELMTPQVVDPCVGTGILTNAARKAGYLVHTNDIYDWSREPELSCEAPQHIGDWLNRLEPVAPFIEGLGKWTAFMNPPFQTACEFIERAFELGAYKVICFQRFAWRSSDERVEFWKGFPPARIWLCIDRASCYRFDIPSRCPNPDLCENGLAKKQKSPMRCRECMSGTTTEHAFYVWERGHKGAEVICNLRRP
jgi:hypothetical protein